VTKRILTFLLCLAPAFGNAATTCTFTSTPGMSFGAYDDSSPSATDASTSIVVSCARNGGPTPVSATLHIGPSAGSGLIATRSMRSGANIMNYNLYRDAGRTQVWGQTTGVDTSSASIVVPNNGSQTGTLVIYGRVPALQNVPAGTYSDSMQITISP